MQLSRKQLRKLRELAATVRQLKAQSFGLSSQRNDLLTQAQELEREQQRRAAAYGTDSETLGLIRQDQEGARVAVQRTEFEQLPSRIAEIRAEANVLYSQSDELSSYRGTLEQTISAVLRHMGATREQLGIEY